TRRSSDLEKLYHTPVVSPNPFGNKPRQEVLFILKGKIRAVFSTKENETIGSEILSSGDAVLFTEGHFVEFLEDTVFLEVKQGPYPETKDKDRIRLDEEIVGVGSSSITNQLIRNLVNIASREIPYQSLSFWTKVFTLIGQSGNLNTREIKIKFVRDEDKIISLAVPVSLNGDEQALIARYIATVINNGLVSIGAEKVVIDTDEELFRGIIETFDKYFEIVPEETVKGYVSDYNNKKLEFIRGKVKKSFGAPVAVTVVGHKDKQFNPNKNTIIGLDIGRTNIKAVLISQEQVLIKNSYETELEEKLFTADNFIERLVSIISELSQESGINIEEIKAIGIGWPGAVRDNKIAGLSSILVEMQDIGDGKKIINNAKYNEMIDIAKVLSRQLGIEVVVINNDGTVEAFYAKVFMPEINNALFMKLGTSLAGGYINAKGQISQDLSEISKSVTDMHPKALEHKRKKIRGLAKEYVSSVGVVRIAKLLGLDIDLKDKLDAKVTNKGILESVDVGIALEQGNEKAIKVVQEIGRYLADLISEMFRYYGMKSVIIAGGVTQGETGKTLLKTAQDILDKEYVSLGIKISLSTQDVNYGGAIGAAQLANIKVQKSSIPVNEVDRKIIELSRFFGNDINRTIRQLELWVKDFQRRWNVDLTIFDLVLKEEFFRLTDNKGKYTGEIKPGKLAHLDKDYHRGVSLIIADEKGNILIQIRSKDKWNFPLCRDVSASGHLGLLTECIDGVIKEAAEEVFNNQVRIEPNRLIKISDSIYSIHDLIEKKSGLMHYERCISALFMCIISESEKSKIKPQLSEIERFEWATLDEEIARWEEWRRDPEAARRGVPYLDYAGLGTE
ncbi:MAG: ROK family protein, partial [Candidatus Bipolaricaulis sp.]|nr:ROK family protein [Candidatus Bipolaricaulis sp.]